MSAGDVVYTGWLVKSPPEKKLKRYSWRKRWFVLRRGRMSGDPDVLEYFRSRNSRKPIRTIDLQECEVTVHTEAPPKRHLANQHIFVIKTANRVFYLLAKTAEEMNSWVRNIGQICTFSALNDSTESMDSLAQTPTSQQPSPALSRHLPFSVGQETVVNDETPVRDTPSESDSSPPPDYLFLSQCETGKKRASRSQSVSNSECSFELCSLETMSEDVFHSPGTTEPSPSSLSSTPLCPLSLSSSSSLCSGLGDVFRFDRPFCTSFDTNTPPPLPPKPTHLPDHHGPDDTVRNWRPSLLPRRTSLSGLEHFRREFDFSGKGLWNNRLSLNLANTHLPIMLPIAVPESQSEDSYVPMASPPVSSSDVGSDGYIPMSPSMLSNGKALSPLPPVPDVEPPPVNRKLKPRIRVRPPPLDLRGLSTIREFPIHHPLTRTMTEPSATPRCVPLDRRWGWGLNVSEQEGNVTPTTVFTGCESAPWFRRSHLDYLSLDFNSASPSPVQKKPLLDEQRVDYVQVDEQKTQALQNTKTEWKDSRQSKV